MLRLLISSVRATLRARPQRGRPYPRVAPADPLLKNAVVFGRNFFTFMIENQRRYGDFYDVHLPPRAAVRALPTQVCQARAGDQQEVRQKLRLRVSAASAGQRFAQLEMQLVLSQIIRKFDIQLPADRAIAVEPLITLRPRGGVSLQLKKRDEK